jgi:hypothetical protein
MSVHTAVTQDMEQFMHNSTLAFSYTVTTDIFKCEYFAVRIQWRNFFLLEVILAT